jgi:hypothetical protein
MWMGIPHPLLIKLPTLFYLQNNGMTWVGLSITYDITKALNGEITVTNAERKGRDFAVLLPVI